MKRMQVKAAIVDMRLFHAGQLDKSGVSYYHHPYRVMVRLGVSATEDEKIAALFHDVVEDTNYSLSDLFGMGYSEESLEMVAILTKLKAVTHRQYLQTILDSGNVGAMRVKLADLYDNSWTRRLAEAPAAVQEDLIKMVKERYLPSIMLLRERLGFAAAGIIEGDLGALYDY